MKNNFSKVKKVLKKINDCHNALEIVNFLQTLDDMILSFLRFIFIVLGINKKSKDNEEKDYFEEKEPKDTFLPTIQNNFYSKKDKVYTFSQFCFPC